jgi:Site-specific recombinase XerD
LCGIEKNLTFHCARHSAASLALSNGMPIESVAKMLGHKNIRTTQLYAKITDIKLAQDMDELEMKLDF